MRNSTTQFIVFDAVGTLIYAEPSVSAVYTAVGRRFGSKLDERLIALRFRQSFAKEDAIASHEGGRASDEMERERWRRIVRQVLADIDDPEGCFSELFAHFARPDSWRLFPEVPGVLAALRASGMQVGVASNFDSRLFEILRSIESTRGLDFVLASTEAGFRKPHRAFFDAIVERAGTDRSVILYVGDDPLNDVQAARAAGLQAILVNRENATGHDAIRSLEDLQKVIGLSA